MDTEGLSSDLCNSPWHIHIHEHANTHVHMKKRKKARWSYLRNVLSLHMHTCPHAPMQTAHMCVCTRICVCVGVYVCGVCMHTCTHTYTYN